MSAKPKSSSRERSASGGRRKSKTSSARGSRRPASLLRIKRILVPVDFSDASRQALDQAAALAKQFRARLVAVHVLEPVLYPSDMAFAPLAPEFPAGISVNSARKHLKSWVEDSGVAKLFARKEVRVGQPYFEIVEAAKDLGADMIVISTHGYTGLKHVLLGSTAERIVRHATCPVLTIRQKE